ncbi:carbohydrate ABC transporter membrane protein 2, CUT1 family (TC 3.A.1.1.-) [Promicromonospora umidemergens]|uniref:Carbohydrate ABC transporter permease n=1 Tax=Promicromonospora umidemergens TaxID=629679 RepID=A0ABP8Y8H4_9MICO|nr:carbohydrate ABC transporter permease [Promicromonospora umidemergens]MCP2284731.1 carbohydrate ABC transporter membrane protein 2, CUT1 family (TC 3.A.1.1.-) [Promicromonospora umidemergens]
MSTVTTPRPVGTRRLVGERPGPASRRGAVLPTVVLFLGALYCLVPVAWVLVASTKSSSELFSTFTFLPGTGLLENLRDLFAYGDGQYVQWALNSVLFAGVGAVACTVVSTMAGYALAKYDFPGRQVAFYAILGGVLLPGITLAIPQYLLMSKVGLAGTYWSVLLPCLISPFGIFLARVYAMSAVPTETMEAARIDGANDARVFVSVALPMMVPGMVTIFLLQFVGIWNNFLLPFIMLSDERMYPLTVGLYTLLSKGSGTPSLYTLAIIGSAVAIIPLVAMMLVLQRYWRLDLISGGLKG